MRFGFAIRVESAAHSSVTLGGHQAARRNRTLPLKIERTLDTRDTIHDGMIHWALRARCEWKRIISRLQTQHEPSSPFALRALFAQVAPMRTLQILRSFDSGMRYD